MANSRLINTESRTQTHADDVRRRERCADPQISVRIGYLLEHTAIGIYRLSRHPTSISKRRSLFGRQ